MIDEYYTFIFFGYHSYDLKSKSNRKIVAVCDNCCKYRLLNMAQYTDLCRSCVRKGKITSDEIRSKMSAAQSGDKNHFFGKHHTEETKLKMSKCKIGGVHTDEHRRKNSISQTGRHHTEETKLKLSLVFRGRIVSEETRQKISKSRSGKPLSEEHKRKISNTSSGKVLPNEHKRRISAGHQHIPYDEWESFAINQEYCPKFDEVCRESNREKYDRRCFLCDKPESEEDRKLSVHHVDMNKNQGCDGHEWKLVPLCRSHHASVHTKVWQSRITYLLKHVWI